MPNPIICLPQDVVDRIAAGEVVQRPVSVVKELLENSLDAGATKVVVTFTPPVSVNHESCGKIVVSDNGTGMSPQDLPLAAVRHATSKLRSVADFDHLESFGFRGEALASVSMVARLNIITRTKDSASGYTMTYLDGKPTDPKPIPRARQVGTTITVSDLFYNIKQRRPSRDDYRQILEVVQKYALLCASRGVGLACEKMGNKQSCTDLNTAMGSVTLLQNQLARPNNSNTEEVADLQRRATKQVITMIYGASLENHLKYMECQQYGAENQDLIYTCTGWTVLPSYTLSQATTRKEKPQFILFINQRLVDCRPMQRSLEDVYTQFAPQKPTFLFLSIQVPPTTVDVNVHPTKRECALLNLDTIVQGVSEHFRQLLEQAGQAFAAAADPGHSQKDGLEKTTPRNPYKRPLRPSQDANENEPTVLSQKSVPPSKKIRTSRATQSGALEPFLVRKEPLSQATTVLSNAIPSSSSPQSTSTSALSQLSQDSTTSVSPSNTMLHKPGCPLAEPEGVDLTQPGAFAAVSSKCTCRPLASLLSNEGAATAIRLPRQALSKPRKIPPKECHYTSIQALRARVQSQTDPDVEAKLRKAYFVGVLGPHRCLVQVAEELVLLDHGEAAQNLFYQLALNYFPGGAAIAKIGPVDIYTVLAQYVQMEEALQSSSEQHHFPMQFKVSETNQVLAEQAAACLLEQSAMLQEYFSIVIEKDSTGCVVLRGLPVLLEGYTPSPHALPLFLLRLATEVCWTEEKPCFHDVSSELGLFYASIPSDDLVTHVRHILFPALTALLHPSKEFVAQKGFTSITKLSKLYRVFERC